MARVEELEYQPVLPFYDQQSVEVGVVDIGQEVPFGLEQIARPEIGVSVTYGTWGDAFDNDELHERIVDQLGFEAVDARLGLTEQDIPRLNLEKLGFTSRHHSPRGLTTEQHRDLEVAVAAAFVSRTIEGNGWEPEEVDALVMGSTAPVSEDFTKRVTEAVGMREDALIVDVHAACDSSVRGMHMVLNPDHPHNAKRNLAEELFGKKVVVGGFEGLSRFLEETEDVLAAHLFANAGGFVAFTPGESLTFLAGASKDVYDEKGVLAVRMQYPHDGSRDTNIYSDRRYMRIAGAMHEPEEGPVSMDGGLAMVSLFVKEGRKVMIALQEEYREQVPEEHDPGVAAVSVHHANLRINSSLVDKLQKAGMYFPVTWTLSEFGNVSAASNMIDLGRKLPRLQAGDEIVIFGFGAGTGFDGMRLGIE